MNLDKTILIQLAYALGIGVLMGLERSLVHVLATRDSESEVETAETDKRDYEEFIGVRTFALLALIGFASALAGELFAAVPAVLLAGIVLLIIAMYFRAVHMGFGITTEVAAIGCCVLGMLCRGHQEIAGVMALVFTVLLASKGFTQKTIAHMRRVELTDTLKFLVVILIVLPLLPKEALDPWGVAQPFKIGVLLVLISGISFVGYFLTRILGAQRGLGLTGILGGLTSSTAVTAAMAADAKRQPAFTSICAFSTLAANATMFVRVLVVVAVLNRALAMQLLWPVGGMALTAAMTSLVLWFVASKNASADDTHQQPELKNPFSLGPAIKFAAFFVAILFIAKFASAWGSEGLYLAAVISGLADVDAITLSIAEQAGVGTLPLGVGAIGITIAIVSNSVVKTGIAVYSGGWQFGKVVALGLGLSTLVGLGLAFYLA